MIIANIKDLRRYVKVNPYFIDVCQFLENLDISELSEGRIEINGDNVFANYMTYTADGKIGDFFETHHKYLDIHLTLENQEKMAVTSLDKVTARSAFNKEDDVVLFDGTTEQIVTLTPGNCLITFAEDIHQPKIKVNDALVKKLVIKVLNSEVKQ
ncbi:YhcH/YjgK/YiaL family protein [Agrilactobacillus yilanensis]|uniref:YhcH/YjgK/YiaL family protein n=1 Tax=Agrilactobacillus yilanensis TaxID=2485997 RepID=A0ABW4J8S7_9LACO|nr:YhcH/YjgK/YiaL family protein [Agrilactobacillus yilanensis]